MNRNSIVPWPPFTPLFNGSLPLSQKGLSSPNMVAFNELWSKLQLSSCALLRHFLASAKELKSRRNISVTTEGYQEQSKINPARFFPQLRNQMDGCNQTKKELSVGWHENKQKGSIPLKGDKCYRGWSRFLHHFEVLPTFFLKERLLITDTLFSSPAPDITLWRLTKLAR